MLKRFLTLVGAVALLTVGGCCSSCNHGGGTVIGHCECPCYGKALQRDGRQIMDVIDVHFLNYDRHDPFRCDPCIGD
jgi:hypothetical protein